MSDRIRFNLLENALDFLKSAVEYTRTRDEDERNIKYGLLHLCDGIELLIKCRLNAEHWTLVLENVDRTSVTNFATGDFRSASWENSIRRLEEIVGVAFSKKEKRLLEHLRKLRNRIQHFDVSISRDEGVSVLAEGLHLAVQFSETKLVSEEWLEEDLKEVRKALTTFDEFVAHRMRALESRIAEIQEWGFVVPCPQCRQDALFADSERTQCLFCGYAEDGEKAADAWMQEFGPFRSIKDQMIEPLIERCPECGKLACARVRVAFEECQEFPDYYCFSCGMGGDYDYCLQCGELFSPSGDELTCGDCFERFMEND